MTESAHTLVESFCRFQVGKVQPNECKFNYLTKLNKNKIFKDFQEKVITFREENMALTGSTVENISMQNIKHFI